jgi:Domain of unknown function (DUF4112)
MKSDDSTKKPEFVEVEVLPPEGKPRWRRPAADQGEPDPFLALISHLMDSAFVIPGTNIRFGLDPIIGLFPGLGDQVGALISAGLLFRSAQHRLPKIILARMGLNVLINSLIGSLPVIGDLFSVWFRSNDRNYELLRRYAGQGREATRWDWIFVLGLIGSIFFLIVFLSVLSAYALIQSFRWW